MFTVSFQTSRVEHDLSQSWDMIRDTPINIIHKDPGALIHENLLTMPQLAVIKQLKPGMFSKEAVKNIASVLGKPLHGEYIISSKELMSTIGDLYALNVGDQPPEALLSLLMRNFNFI